MPPIEVGPARGPLPVDARLARQAGVNSEPAPGAAKPVTVKAAVPATGAGRAVSISDALDPGEAPVDVERVQLIRKAVESGTYPVVPTRIADAMIAAGLMLRSAK